MLGNFWKQEYRLQFAPQLFNLHLSSLTIQSREDLLKSYYVINAMKYGRYHVINFLRHCVKQPINCRASSPKRGVTLHISKSNGVQYEYNIDYERIDLYSCPFFICIGTKATVLQKKARTKKIGFEFTFAFEQDKSFQSRQSLKRMKQFPSKTLEISVCSTNFSYLSSHNGLEIYYSTVT